MWSELPIDLLGLIARCLAVDDFILFSCVCRSWKSAAVKENLNSQQLPWLMLADEKGDDGDGSENRMFYDISENWNPEELPWATLAENNDDDDDDDNDDGSEYRMFYNISKKKCFKLKLPEVQGGRRCWGSSSGWLCSYSLDYKFNLVNPLTRAQVSLPSLATFIEPDDGDREPEWYRNYYIRKIIVFDETTTVFAILGLDNSLCIARPGDDEKWILMTRVNAKAFLSVEDVEYFKGHVFALRWYGDLFVCDLNHPEGPKAVVFASSPPLPVEVIRRRAYNRMYLVNCFGSLLMVYREVYESEDLCCNTRDFYVYELDYDKKEWRKIDDLGDCVLFLGPNKSMSVKASSHFGCRKNCIYYTDDNNMIWESTSDRPNGAGYDTGVFSLEDSSIQRHYAPTDPYARSSYCCPIWIVPSF